MTCKSILIWRREDGHFESGINRPGMPKEVGLASLESNFADDFTTRTNF
jgi:hypothetical protein